MNENYGGLIIQKKVSFDCVVLTPLYNHGAFNKKINKILGLPELRTSSFKGIFRYWWRALQYERSLSVLREKEINLFGGIQSERENEGFRSKIKLILDYSPKNTAYILFSTMASRSGKNTQYAIKPGEQFRFQVIAHNDISNKNWKQLIAVMQLALQLGGVGLRARRAMGSIIITNKQFMNNIYSGTEIIKLLEQAIGNTIKPVLQDSDNNTTKISIKNNANEYKYPVLKEIILGQEFTVNEIRETLENINHARRRIENDQVFKQNQIDNVLGKVQKGRLASPVWVKVITNGKYFRIVYSVFHNPNIKWSSIHREIIQEYIRLTSPSSRGNKK